MRLLPDIRNLTGPTRFVNWRRVVAFRSTTSARPTTPADERVYPRMTRWGITSFAAALRAVAAGLTLPEHLRPRLAACLRFAPQNGHPLPRTEITDAGELAVEAPVDPRSAAERVLGDPSFDGDDGEDSRDPIVGDARFLRAEAESQAALVGREIDELESEARAIEKRLRETQELLETVQHEEDEAIAAGTKALQAGKLAPAPRQLVENGPSQAAILGCRIAQAVLLTAEAIQIALPLMHASGLDASAVNLEIAHNPLTTALLAITACGVAFALFVATRFVFEKGTEMLHATGYAPRRPYVLAATASASALVLAGLWVVAQLRAELAASAGALNAVLREAANRPSISSAAYFTLSIAMLVGAVLFHGRATDLAARRIETLRRAATPTAEEAAHVRRIEMLRNTADLRAQLQQRRDTVNLRVREITEGAHAEEQVLREQALARRTANALFLADLIAVIEKDRYYFMLVAKRRKRPDLLPSSASVSPTPEQGKLVRLPRTRRMS
jgi:hypothetical protein